VKALEQHAYLVSQHSTAIGYGPNTMTEQEYKEWWEQWSKEHQLKRALREKIYYIIHGIIFMFASWFCTYMGIVTQFLPMFCITIVSVVAVYYAIYSIYNIENKIAELVADLM